MFPVRRTLAAALSAALVTATVACSGDSDADSDAGTATRLDVGVVTVIDVAPLYLGIEKGFFSRQRLEVTPKPRQGGSLIVAAVVSGSQHIGFSNNTSLLIGASRGLPLRIVAAGNQAAAGDYAAIFTRAGSGIGSAKDLGGKTIAVNNLNNVGPPAGHPALQGRGGALRPIK